MPDFTHYSPRRFARACVALLVVALLCPPLVAQAQVKLKRPRNSLPNATVNAKTSNTVTFVKPLSSEVPLVLRGVYPLVEVEINGHPATLLVDTGSSDNLITPKAAQRLGLQVGQETIDGVGIGGVVSGMRTTQIDTFKVGNFVRHDQQAIVYDLPEVFECDGLLGTPFIGAQVTTLDYENKVLRLTRNEDFVPSAADTVVPLEFIHDLPSLPLELGDKRSLFTLDTGSGSSVTLYDSFVAQNKLRETYKAVVPLAKSTGIGGTAKGDYVRLPSVKIGAYELTKVIVTFLDQTPGISSETKIGGHIGGSIWQRFTLTLDYKNKRLYLRPNSAINKSFDSLRFGATIKDGKVMDVAPNTPAQEAGVVSGDTILSINSKTVSEYFEWYFSEATVKSAQDAKLRLRLRGADGKEREVTVTLRDLI